MGAKAEGDPVALEWNVPEGEGCPTAAEVLAQVSKLVEASRPSARAAVRARADVEKLREGRFRVELTTMVGGKQGRRVLEERSCGAMAEATVLILAWMVDPSVIDASEPPLPAPAPAAPPVAKRPAPPPVAREPPRREVEFLVGVEGLADLGTLPDFAPGIGVGLGVRFRWFEARVRGGLWASQTTKLPGLAAGAKFQLYTVGLDACVVPWPVDVGFCAGPELDHMQGTGFGVANPRTDGDLWLALGFGAFGRLGLVGPLAIAGGLRLMVPTDRERFGLDGLAVVHRASAVAGRANLGLEISF